MRIGLDVDGVFARFETGFLRLLPAKLQAKAERMPEDELLATWHWPVYCLGMSWDEYNAAWKKIKASDSFWLGLEPMPGAREALITLADWSNEHEIYFLTARRFGVTPKQQTERWLMMHGFPAATVLLVQDGHKGPVAHALGLDVFIDDLPDNLRGMGRTFPYLMDRPYNRAATPYERVLNLPLWASEICDVKG